VQVQVLVPVLVPVPVPVRGLLLAAVVDAEVVARDRPDQVRAARRRPCKG